jgi:hypothetical protein
MADFTVENQGSLVVFWANTPEGAQWFEDNTDALHWGNGYVVEHRYACLIADALSDEGFSLE